MDDLISRKAVIKEIYAIKEEIEKNALYSGEDSPARCEVEGLYDAHLIVTNAPSVPSVPLNKLCEWLGTHYGSPCQLTDDCDSPCMLDGVGQMSGAECWHYLIKTKVLEKLDGGGADDHG